jgi:2-iminoacetate synthase
LEKEIKKIDEKQKKIVLDGLERINKGDRDVRL